MAPKKNDKKANEGKKDNKDKGDKKEGKVGIQLCRDCLVMALDTTSRRNQA
jgi:hypothetical protein